MARVSTGGVGRGVARLPTRQVVDCPRVDGWCRPRCSIAHALTGGIGVSAWAVPSPPPPALVVPLAQRLWMSGRGFFFFIPPFPLSINVNFCYCVLSFFFSIMSPPSPPPPLLYFVQVGCTTRKLALASASDNPP
jgi:hypothetical protein